MNCQFGNLMRDGLSQQAANMYEVLLRPPEARTYWLA
jgi:hypothetical protein